MIKENFPDLINDYQENMRESQKKHLNLHTETDKEFTEDDYDGYQGREEKDYGSNIFIANDD